MDDLGEFVSGESMTIYRTNDVTKYSDAVMQSSQLLPGLEAYTGSDLLVTTSTAKLSLDHLTLPSKMAFEKAVSHGRLIQVKCGSDLLNSIENLDSILKRMLAWTPRPWLLFVGDLKESKEGQAIVDGRESGFTWSQVHGAIVTWQERGGLYDHCTSWQMAEVLNGWLPRLHKFEAESFHCVRRPVAQFLVGTPAAVETLATFDGIGCEKAQELLTTCGTLAHSLVQLSDPLCKVSGLGTKTYALAHRRLGLREDEVLQVVVKETVPNE